ncbi:hypothetical protein [Jiangella asiatica]|uniref:Uncharacterized protein n=1 Tax=Jiangella asiatica TaxID=2530372 RepID=A0A4R5CER3_9ACTN|nr:hypothetical protein [Jiangella asiatica]TDD95694.1 hypothetical protein E1269_31075 [Jiangella asiatica]
MAQSPRTIPSGDIQDERVAALPLATAYTYVYLPTALDDEGRAVDQPAVLNGMLWPLRIEEHPAAAMSADLTALADAGLICRYTVEGRDYLHDPAWRRRQRLSRPERSTLPRCPIHESGLRELVEDTLSSVSDQVSSIIGGAAANVGQSRVRDTVARIVEDVTFPVDPEKAATYGQRIREFLSGATDADRPDDDAERSPSGRAEPLPAAGTVPVSVDTAPEAEDAGPPSTPGPEPADGGAGSPEAEAKPADVWRDATDDPSPGETR